MPERVDIHVEVSRVQEVPMPTEEIRTKEYFVERINEVRREEVVPKRVVLKRRVEQPRLNKIYQDEKVIKEVEVVREVIDEQIVEVEEVTTEDVPVTLKTTAGRINIRKVPKHIQLQRIQERGVLNPQQKREFETASRRLADMEFEKQKLQRLIEYARSVDLRDINVDQNEFRRRLQEIQVEMREIQRSIQELIRRRDELSRQFTISSDYNFDEQYDNECLNHVNSDIERVRRINEELRRFL